MINLVAGLFLKCKYLIFGILSNCLESNNLTRQLELAERLLNLGKIGSSINFVI